MRLIACAALLVPAAFAQNVEPRVFTFAHIEGDRPIQEFVNTVRSVGDIRNVAADASARTLSVAGTPDQLAFTQWLFDSLDQPASARPQSLDVRNTAVSDTRGETAIKVVYAAHLANPQTLQETVNAVRALGEIQRVTVYSSAPAIVLRSTPEAAALGEWLIRQADEAAAGSTDRSTRDYRFDDARLPVERRAPAVRVFWPATMRTPLQIQEAVNVLRSIVEVQRVVAFTTGWGIAIRGTEAQAVAADWLVRQLDGQSSAGASMPFGDQILRTLFLPGRRTPQQIMETVNMLRQSTGMQRVVAYQGRSAIVLRGTGRQVEEAATLLR